MKRFVLTLMFLGLAQLGVAAPNTVSGSQFGVGSASGTIANFNVTRATITNLSGGFGNNIAANGLVLTGLGAGSANGQSARYEQLKILQLQWFKVTTTSSNATATYVPSALTVTITPLINSSTITVLASGVLIANSASAAVTAKSALATVFRGNTNLATGAGAGAFLAQVNQEVSGIAGIGSGFMMVKDQPLINSATTYTVNFRSGDTTQAAWGNTEDQWILVIESQ